MLKFSTKRGWNYYYSSKDNRIRPLSCEYKEQHEGKHAYVSSDEYILNRISMFTIEVTQQCNLRCKYCCYSGAYDDRREHSSNRLSTIDTYKCVDFIGDNIDKDSPQITICFYGGEALLAKDTINTIIQELKTRFPLINFVFSISSNGVLLNKSNIDWIAITPNLQIVITIDGDKLMHDKNRLMIDGSGSYDRIMHNIKLFYDNYPDLYYEKVHFISTVNSIRDLIKLNTFWMDHELLKHNRPRHISSIIPNFSKGETIKSDEKSFVAFYEAAINSYFNGEENILTDELNRFINIIKHRHLSITAPTQEFITCMHKPYSAFITSEGNIYVCERMIADNHIGTLDAGIEPNKCKDLNMRFTARKNAHCSSCWAKRLCRICAMNLNNTEEQFIQYCESERMQLKLALQYYCEILEHNNCVNYKSNV